MNAAGGLVVGIPSRSDDLGRERRNGVFRPAAVPADAPL